MSTSPKSHSLRSALINVGVLALSVLLVLAVAEVAIRLLYPRSDRYYVLTPNEQLVQRPSERYVKGVEGTAEYRTSSWGIRGPEFGPDSAEYRILAVGGSTTQDLYLDQTETWTLLVGRLLGPTASGLKTWTGDVGTSGRTARDHVLQVRYLLPQLPRIDAVVMLVGVNDLTAALREGFDYQTPPDLSDPAAERVQLPQAFVQVPGGINNRLPAYWDDSVNPIKKLALYQLARVVKMTFQQSRSRLVQDPLGAVYLSWRQFRSDATEIVDSLPDLGPPLAEYRGYLEDIAKTTKEHHARLILLTQPTLWRADLTPEQKDAMWLGGMGDFQSGPGHPYFSAGALRRAMDAYNRTLLDVCAEQKVECIDLAADLPKDLTVFYDDVHFTELGSRLVAERLADYLRQRPPYAPPG